MSDNIIFRIKSSYTDNAGVEQALNVPGGAPNSGSVFYVKKGEGDARIFIFESVQLIEDIYSINILPNITTSAARSVGAYWSNTPIWKIHNHETNCTPTTSDWNALRDQWYDYPLYNQYLCVRVGASTNSSSSVKVTVNSISITAEGEIIRPTVQINYPNTDSCTIYNKRPNFQMTGTDPTNLRLGYEYRIDNSNNNSNNWINISNVPINSGTPKKWSLSTDLSVGTHTLEVRAYNENYDYSDTKSRTFTYAVPTRVSANIPIQKSQMDTLKTYIDNISNYYGTGSDVTIAAPSQHLPLNNTNWDKYREKINKIPSKPGLNSPSKGAAATAAYYNSYITVLENG